MKLFALLAALCLTGCAVFQESPEEKRAHAIATRIPPMTRIKMGCVPLVETIVREEKAAGIPAAVLSFWYLPPVSKEPQIIMGHALAVYWPRNVNGKRAQWFMDNNRWQPSLIHGKTPLDIARWHHAIEGANAHDVAYARFESATSPLGR